MTMNYTAAGEIIRGSYWPPGGDVLTLVLTRSTGWVGADGWTWELVLSRTIRGGDPDLELEAASVTVDGTHLTLTVRATDDETAGLPKTNNRTFAVELRSTSDDDPAEVSYWDAAQGIAMVRSPAGEA